jgi:polar amino acid transport system substrate-binding protein
MQRIVLVCALALTTLPACALELLTEENPPFNYAINGVPGGPATQIVKEMARRAEIPGEVKLLVWKDAYERALNGDACVFSTARNAQRFDLFQWVGPIMRGQYSAFGRDGFKGQVKRVDDLKTYRIGVVNDARAAYLKERGFTNLVIFDSDRDIPKQLGAGVDLWVTQALRAGEIASAAGVTDLKEVFAAILAQDYFLACGKKVSAQTVAKLSDAIAAMRKDGGLRKILLPGALN